MDYKDEFDSILKEFSDAGLPQTDAEKEPERFVHIPVEIRDNDFISLGDFVPPPPPTEPLPNPLLPRDEDDPFPFQGNPEKDEPGTFERSFPDDGHFEVGSKSGRPSLFWHFLCFVFVLLSLLSLGWVTVNVHPDTASTASVPADRASLDLVSRFSRHMNNVASDALGELVYIPKQYSIDEDVLIAPKPDSARFGATTDPTVIRSVIDDAADLLGGQEMAWSPDIKLYDDEQFHYYLDDTILAIAWKEEIDGMICSFSEVKIADGSQLRRKLAGDSYGSSIRILASDMAKQVNAVAAINGDFYTYRDFGITVYQRKLYRFENRVAETCFFTASGDMLFTLRNEFESPEQVQQFVDENDVVFSIAFGPVLVDNGEQRIVEGYALGEVFQRYSRAAIGMTDELHYLLMTINFEDNHHVATINEEGKVMFDKGCVKAYALDGGQTSTMVFNGSLINRVDWDDERTMSDIIYFATAIPESEVNA